MQVDPYAQTFGLPKCFLTPIASKSIEAIEKYIGRVVPVDSYPQDAFIVYSEKYESPNNFDVWNHPRASLINSEKQLWVGTKFKHYKKLYNSFFQSIETNSSTDIDHLMNRHQAEFLGFRFIRLLHLNCNSNRSSGAGPEKLSIKCPQNELLSEEVKEQQIEYADTFVLAKILNLTTGGRPFYNVGDLNPVFYNGELMIDFYRNELINLLKHIIGFDRKSQYQKKLTKKQFVENKERVCLIEHEIGKLKRELIYGGLNNHSYYDYRLNYTKKIIMTTGRVKILNLTHKYGFIAPDDGTSDIFFSFIDIIDGEVAEGDFVQYRVFEENSRRGKKAIKIVKI